MIMHHDECSLMSLQRWPFEGGETWRKELRHDALPELLITRSDLSVGPK